MAARGTKPKPVSLHLIQGTDRSNRQGKKADLQKQVAAVQASHGPLVKPAFLQGEASEAWDDLIAPAGWLDGTKALAAIALCELWREFRYDPPAFSAGKHGQMRGYMAELGLTDERNRKVADAESTDPADKYF